MGRARNFTRVRLAKSGNSLRIKITRDLNQKESSFGYLIFIAKRFFFAHNNISFSELIRQGVF
jgi:hypothetical protein